MTFDENHLFFLSQADMSFASIFCEKKMRSKCRQSTSSPTTRVILAPGALENGENPVISAPGTSGTGEDSVISSPNTPAGHARTQSFQLLVPPTDMRGLNHFSSWNTWDRRGLSHFSSY